MLRILDTISTPPSSATARMDVLRGNRLGRGLFTDVCAGRTAAGRVHEGALTISPDVLARSMDLEWGSRARYDSFVRRRPRVEGANGTLKNPTFAPWPT